MLRTRGGPRARGVTLSVRVSPGESVRTCRPLDPLFSPQVHPPNGHMTQYWRKDNVFTSPTRRRRRRVDVVKTLLLRRVPAGLRLGIQVSNILLLGITFSFGATLFGWNLEEMSHSENAAALLSQMRFQNADAISKCRCDFKTQMRFQNADAISKRRCDFKTQMRFQNADAISKRRCDFKMQMRFQNADAISKRRCVYKTPGYLYCECNRSSIYLGDAYHNKLYAGELRI